MIVDFACSWQTDRRAQSGQSITDIEGSSATDSLSSEVTDVRKKSERKSKKALKKRSRREVRSNRTRGGYNSNISLILCAIEQPQ
ncbi:hypothetical protein [Microcoleus asticus]|uniref:hypothetical protein n=1 Tax=Microcoleus asticus TaxID=2815231 RepID=UPI0015558B60|nr:hypothetical protein [Microcoleus asticus]